MNGGGGMTDDFIQMVHALVKKVDVLETELRTIKEQMGKRRTASAQSCKKEDLLEQMNQPDKLLIQRETTPPFTKWFNGTVLDSVKDYLDIVFQNDIIYGIMRLLENSVTQSSIVSIETIPIRTFERKTHTYFYVFDVKEGKEDDDYGSACWKKVYFQEMEKYTWLIYQRFNKDFYKYWCVPNETRIANMDDEYSKLYIDYFKAVLGNTTISQEKRNYKICSLFYKVIKELE